MIDCAATIAIPRWQSHAAESEPPAPAFQVAEPGYVFKFPFDHGAHQAFQTEWWYYTGHLETVSGRSFGYQVTFFRRGIRRKPDTSSPVRSKWRLDDLYFAHLALSDLRSGRFHFFDRVSREGLGTAGADGGRLRVWLDRWRTEMPDVSNRRHHLAADEQAGGAEAPDGLASIGIDLELTPLKAPVIHGTDGVSRKGADPRQSSHYYSLTRLATSGTLTLDGHALSVTGLSWMDHEFGSGDLSSDLDGWDWFSMQLESGEELMLYQLRRHDGLPDAASSGTWVDRTGRSTHLAGESIRIDVLEHWKSPHSHASYPSRWRVSIAPLHAVIEVIPQLSDQELLTGKSTGVTYWEGAARMTGMLGDRPITGHGYVELTGYTEPYRPGRHTGLETTP